ncbi:MAG: cell wall-binding repeat-containing protein, partial [Actinomycetota bacterium]|nr:cell wall-binding repeat-containing protein [Actinomycetota bacterium]
MTRTLVAPRRLLEVFLVVGLLVATLAAGPPEAEAGGTIEIPAAGRVGGGVYSTEWSISTDLDGLASATGKRVTFGGTFHNVFENDGTAASWSNTREILDEVWKGKATPFANVGINTSAYQIAGGTYDSKIAEWATHVKQYLDLGGGRTVIIAPLQEMNYGGSKWGCDPGNYKTAYRKFVDTFRSMGMDETKVRWAFAPNNWTSPGCGSIADYYPGDAYVDVIGISAYNWGTCVGSRWESPAQVYGPALNELRNTVSALKPYVLAQTAAPRSSHCGGDQQQWVRDAFTYLSGDPNVVGLMWFNFVKETDWRIWAKPTVSTGWRDAMTRSSTTYEWPLASWFKPGTLTVSVPEGVGDAVVVLGGPAAISDGALFDISGALGGMPGRIAGPNRYSTAARVSESFFDPGVGAVYLVTGEGFADALSAGAAAAMVDGPLLLVRKDSIPEETRTELARLRPKQIFVAGGPVVISQSVVDGLRTYATSGSVTRLSGANRYGTAAAVAAAAFPGGVDTVYLASGLGFADALAAGAAAVTVDGAVLLSRPEHLPVETAASIRNLHPSEVILVGGTAALFPTIEPDLRALGVASVRRIAGSDRYTTSAIISSE